MADKAHLHLLKQGVAAWNHWREKNPDIQPDLIGANLRRANLRGADLRGADLSGATVGYNTFGNVDLRPVKGLETVKHDGPSTIGLDTIYRSHGQIPEPFLRGAGIDDTFITYLASLTARPIQYYSCFISHASNDKPFAQRLYADLQANNVRCWYAPEDLKEGQKRKQQLDHAIRQHDKLLLILSEHSLHSEWVIKEIRQARSEELIHNQRKLFPIRLVDWPTIKNWRHQDEKTTWDLAEEIHQYFVPDFTHWKDHDAYQQAFDHLLRDLKAASEESS